MKRTTIVIIYTVIIIILIFLFYLQKTEDRNNRVKIKNYSSKMKEKTKKEAQVLLIVANNFQGIEFEGVKSVLEKQNIPFEVASNIKIPESVQGNRIEVDILIPEIEIGKYKALVFIGGPGSIVYFDDSVVLGIVKEAFEKELILGAICIAPIILANANLLKGKKATVWDDGSGEYIKRLEEKGAIFVEEDVVKDGNIITANGPHAAIKFGEAIINAII